MRAPGKHGPAVPFPQRGTAGQVAPHTAQRNVPAMSRFVPREWDRDRLERVSLSTVVPLSQTLRAGHLGQARESCRR